MVKYFGLGRRKSARAQVVIFGETLESTQTKATQISINKKQISDHFQNDSDALIPILQFFKTFGFPQTTVIKVSGGGKTGQNEAICLALAKAYSQMGFSSLLKKQNLLTQDGRVKERKKYGLKKARKAPQYSKR
uniref:Small ribosomal subunit protein uS9c n=1 Tax=Pseudocodium devriesii TaxID=453070 RepID=A0A386B135_9CHLO|nr:ribosomal protein S9 [Pseudocodium devriesii]AYC65400.1 ribosomal protein S9 [Pseudocodium devriesii]